MKTSTKNQILFKKLTENAILPSRSEPDSAGLDLYAAETCVIKPLSRVLVKTGIAWSASKGLYGKIEGRSGRALKQGLSVLGGVIDNSYRADIGCILFNTDMYADIKINAGDRIAQLIIQEYVDSEVIEVSELPNSFRNELGFGSSGG